MSIKRYLPNIIAHYSPDKSTRLFVHYLALAISFYEISSTDYATINRAAANLTSDHYRRVLYALLPILDSTLSESQQL